MSIASHILIRCNQRPGKVSLAREDEIMVVFDDGSTVDISAIVRAHRITSQVDELRVASIDFIRFEIETFEREPMLIGQTTHGAAVRGAA